MRHETGLSEMTPRLVAMLLMVAVMTVWGSTFVVTKSTIGEIPPLTLAFIRVGTGALVLLPFAIYRRVRTAARAPVPWGATAMLGFIGVTLYYVSFNLAMAQTSAAQGALVQSSIPAMTALCGVLLLRERASRTRVAGIALSVIGVLIVLSGTASAGAVPVGAALDSAASPWGNVLMFVSVILWGIYTALAKRIADHDAVITTACIIGLGAVMLLPFALHELRGQPFPVITLSAWSRVFYLGAVASGLAFLVYNFALRSMDAGQAGVFANLIPIVGVLSGVVLLHEPLSLRAIVGGGVVMLGVWITGAERTPRTLLESPAR